MFGDHSSQAHKTHCRRCFSCSPQILHLSAAEICGRRIGDSHGGALSVRAKWKRVCISPQPPPAYAVGKNAFAGPFAASPLPRGECGKGAMARRVLARHCCCSRRAAIVALGMGRSDCCCCQIRCLPAQRSDSLRSSVRRR